MRFLFLKITMTSRYMFDGLKVDSRYLDYKKGSTYRPNEDFFKEGLNKVKVLFNTAPKSGMFVIISWCILLS